MSIPEQRNADARGQEMFPPHVRLPKFCSSTLPQEDSDVVGLHTAGPVYLDGGLVFAGGWQAGILGGIPGAAAVLNGDCEGASLSSRWGHQVRVKAQRHAAVGVVLLARDGSCRQHTAVQCFLLMLAHNSGS